MKTSIAGVAVLGGLLMGIVTGHPHKIKRAVVTEVTYTTVTAANVIVWVNEAGIPVETTTQNLLPTKSKPTPAHHAGLAVDDNAVLPPVAKPATSVVGPVQPSFKSVFAPDVTIASSVAVASSSAPKAPSPTPETAVPAPVTSAPVPEVSSPAPEAPPPTAETSAPAPVTSAPAPEASSPAPEAPVTPVSPPVSSSAPETTTSYNPKIESPSKSPKVETPTASASPSAKPYQDRPETTADRDRFPIGVTYDPFKSGDCKDENQITNEWNQMKQYGIIRVYGMGCNLIPIAVKLAQANKQKLFPGIWLTNGGGSEDVDTWVKTLTSAVRNAGGDWNIISMVSVENERVNDHDFTPSDVIDAVKRVRTSLQYAGYNGLVGAVETVPAMLDNPAICENSDVALVNVHSFFDSNTAAEESGQFVKDQVARVQQKCNKRVVVCEAGWPHQGDSHDKAVPSRENQKKAIDSILGKFDHDLFLFNAFDSTWKSDWAGSFNAERYWGIVS